MSIAFPRQRKPLLLGFHPDTSLCTFSLLFSSSLSSAIKPCPAPPTAMAASSPSAAPELKPPPPAPTAPDSFGLPPAKPEAEEVWVVLNDHSGVRISCHRLDSGDCFIAKTPVAGLEDLLLEEATKQTTNEIEIYQTLESYRSTRKNRWGGANAPWPFAKLSARMLSPPALLVTAIPGTELFKRLKEEPGISLFLRLWWALDLCRSLRILHALGIAHLDVSSPPSQRRPWPDSRYSYTIRTSLLDLTTTFT